MGIVIYNRAYTIQELSTQSIPSDLKSDHADTLRFCQKWLTGCSEFSIKTSGSTGKPKTIRLSRKQMQVSAHLTGQALGLHPQDHALICLPIRYIAGMMMFVRCFELGLGLTAVEPSSNPLTQFDENAHFDFTALIPFQLQQIFTESPDKIALLNQMKAILIGGAEISPSLLEQIKQMSGPVYHSYGMTETATHIALKRLNGSQATSGFVPLPDVEIALDERGCLTIRHPVLTHGETLYSNDLCEILPDGSFLWLGRVDNVINSGAVKVQIEKVEMALAKFLLHYKNGVLAHRRFFISGLEHPKLGQTVVAIFEGDSLSSKMQAEIRHHLASQLDKYEIPREFYALPFFRETSTGKIDRAENLRKLLGK